MSPTQLVSVCVRIGGLLLLLPTLRTVLAMIPMSDRAAIDPALFWPEITVLVATLVIALCMTFQPLIVAGNWLRKHGDQPLAFAWSRGVIESTAFTLLGLYFAIAGLIDACYWALFAWGSKYFAIESGGLPANPFLTPDRWAGAIATAIQVAIGIWLIFGARGLRDLLRWARDRAQPGATEE